MILTTPVETEVLTAAWTASTAVQPDEVLEAFLTVTASRPCRLLAIAWEVPYTLPMVAAPALDLPAPLAPGEPFRLAVPLWVGPAEGYGDLHFTLRYRLETGDEATVQWSAWLSVFSRQTPDAVASLDDRLRTRLVTVVNARARNGHIFMGNPVAFFSDFLNIEVPPRRVDLINREFGLAIEGIPVDADTYMDLVLGRRTFYSIQQLELFPDDGEEEEEDACFEAPDLREVTA